MARNMGRSGFAPANGNGVHEPSPNGNGVHEPSTNGNGVHEPSTNGSGVQEAAMSGCAWATKLMLQYLVGKPVAAPNPDRVNHEEWEMRLEQPRSEEWELQRQQIPHVGALLVHRQVDVARTQEMANEFRANAARDMAREQKRRERAERRARHKEERRRRGK